jgi:hypothetical protein
MWTSKNRGRYDPGKPRYPSDLTEDEWKLAEPLIRQAWRRQADGDHARGG